ncbi:hypothetical protein GCM10010460_06570 [Microbacterium terrae]|nr:hypothetical protein GCM10017594_04150 [Microbacterium terrae]
MWDEPARKELGGLRDEDRRGEREQADDGQVARATVGACVRNRTYPCERRGESTLLLHEAGPSGTRARTGDRGRDTAVAAGISILQRILEIENVLHITFSTNPDFLRRRSPHE